MNSAEIKTALKQTMGLAPAFARAAEIVESAELAEKRQVELKKENDKLQEVNSDLDAKILQKRQELQKYTQQAESAKPDSKRVRELENREKIITAREAEVAAREQKVSVREEEAKDLENHVALFGKRHSQ